MSMLKILALLSKLRDPAVWAAIQTILEFFAKLAPDQQKAFAAQLSAQVRGVCNASPDDVAVTPEVEAAILSATPQLSACCDEEDCEH